MMLPGLVLCSLLSITSCHHVLFVHTLGTKSHLIQMKPVIEEMLERGHTVTTVFFDSVKIKHENYTDIVIPNILESVWAEASKKIMEKGGNAAFNPSIWWWMYNFYTSKMEQLSLDHIKRDEVMKLIRDRTKIDAVITMVPSNAIFAEIFDCPVIFLSPPGPVSILMKGTTNVINHSIQPYITVPFIEPMTFSERIKNHFMVNFGSVYMNWLTNSMFEHQQKFLKAELGLEVAHPIVTLQKKFSILVACSHAITHGAWQYLPNVIEVGGLALKKPGPLPGDLQEFMDLATDGAVLVSFGSALRPDQMPEEKVALFKDAFKNLGMKVIWKWDVEIPDLPENIKLSSWLPQQDLLGHPNLKVFVTHGGLGSLVEAIYHKAVIVGIPFSNDQKPNLLRAERHGYAARLDWDSLTADDLVASIRKAMEDRTMAENLERVHNIYLDNQERPVDKAVWWIEYVCRHKGADWLKSVGEEVSFFQYHHLDLLSLLLFSILLSLTLTFYFWRAVFRCCCKKKSKTE